MKKQIPGQMSLFDFIEEPKPADEWALPCDTCGHDVKGCCDYDYINNHDYCVLGDKWIPKAPDETVTTVEEEYITPAQEYFRDTGKTTYWQDSQGKPHQWWKKETVTMFGEEWHPLSKKPEGITQYDELRILGPYKSVYGERWSNCPAKLCDGEIVAYDVPWDIPRPDWQYWRLKEKVYPLDIKGICDDPYCPQCGYPFETIRSCKGYEVDCERCPECHIRVDWTTWHRLNDKETEE